MNNLHSSSPLSDMTDSMRSPTSREAGHRAHAVVDDLQSGAHRMVDNLQHAAQRLEPQGRRLVSQTQSYVRTHPLKSLGLALAAGMVVRQLLRR